jgi:hypothetical protein
MIYNVSLEKHFSLRTRHSTKFKEIQFPIIQNDEICIPNSILQRTEIKAQLCSWFKTKNVVLFISDKSAMQTLPKKLMHWGWFSQSASVSLANYYSTNCSTNTTISHLGAGTIGQTMATAPRGLSLIPMRKKKDVSCCT